VKRIILGLLILLNLNLFGNNLEILSKQCGQESLKKEHGNLRVCLKAIKLIKSKFFFSTQKKNESLCSLYNYTAYIYEAKKDYDNAAIMFKKSIALNTGSSNLARINLGRLYYYGQGVMKNYNKAYKLWKQVVKNGDWTGNASNNLDILCQEHPWVCK